MVDVTYDYDPSTDPLANEYDGGPSDGGGVSTGDRARALGVGALDTGAQLASGVRAVGDATGDQNISNLGDFFGKLLKYGSKRTEEGMSDDAREQLHAAVTSPEFWEHPVSAGVLKALNMTPAVAASIAPVMLTDGALAPWLVGGTGAGLGAAASTDDVYSQTDAMSDEDLQKAMPYYAGLRSMGMPEDQARADANTKLMGLKPLLNAMAGGAAMALGPGGRLAGLIPEGAGATLLKRVGAGAAEGALGGAMMGGTGEATHQQTEIELDKRTQLDPAQILAATADSAATMGAMGAVGGVFTGGAAEAPGRVPDAFTRPKETVQTVDTVGPDAAQAVALAGHNQDAAPVTSQVTKPTDSPLTESTPAAEPNSVPGVPKPTPEVAPNDPAALSGPVGPVRGGDNQPGEKGVLNPADDAGRTVPESQPTLQAQQEQLINGQRRAMLFPKGGEKPLPLPEGMKKITTKDGTWHYNPDAIKPKDIYDASKAKTLNTVLDLGDFSKNDLAPRVAAGEAPVAVTERAPEGTEVKAALGTDVTAPSQVASLEAKKTPGNSVQVEPVQTVLTDRVAAAKAAGERLRQKNAPDEKTAALRAQRLARDAAGPVPPEPKPAVKPVAREVIKAEPVAAPRELSADQKAVIENRLASIRQVAEAQERAGFAPKDGSVDAFMERKRQELTAQAHAEAGIEAPKAETDTTRTRSETEKANNAAARDRARAKNRAENNSRADEVVKRFAASDEERSNNANAVGRELLLDRVRGMVEAANKDGVKIPDRLKDSSKSGEHSNGVLLLAEAKALMKSDASTADLTRFISREFALRHDAEEGRRAVLSERRAEGDQKMAFTRSSKIAREAAREESAPEPKEIEQVADETSTREPREEPEEHDEPAAPRETRDRPAVTLTGNEVTAGKDRAGSFKIEKKRRVMRRLGDGESEGRDMSPEAIYEAEKTVHNLKPLHTMSYSAALAKTIKHGYRSGVEATISRHVIPQLQRSIGDLQVRFIDDADMDMLDRIDGPNNDGFGNTAAFYHQPVTHGGKPAIYVRASHLLGDQRSLRHILTHEGIHAATMDAMHRRGPEFRDVFNQMMKDAREHIGEDVAKRTYGFTDPYEFMAEAMSNPRFISMLGEAPASPKLVDKLGMGRLSSLKDAVIRIIRRLLGLKADQYTALEAALRIHNDLIEEVQGRQRDMSWEPSAMAATKRIRAGAFDDPRQQTDINQMFHEPFTEALNRSREDGMNYVRRLTQPGKLIANAIENGKGAGGAMRKALLAVTTNDQYRQQVQHLLPMAREIFDTQERAGVLANKLKEEGLDLTGAMIRAQKANPGLFEKFAKLVNDQTMVGVDASTALGEGRNSHLALAKKVQERIDNGEPVSDVEHEAAMTSWEARNAHPELNLRYQNLVTRDPQYAELQKQLFDYYERTQLEMAKGQLDSILRSYEFKGTDAERAAAVDKLAKGKMTDDDRAAIAAQLGVKDPENALDRIEAVDALKVKKGPYAPLMRRGEHAVIGEYKVDMPANGKQIDDSTYEFKTRKEAHDFAVKTDLHTDTKSVWYDSATGQPVKAKADAISTAGGPEQRFQVRVQKQHLEFHESRKDAAARMKELQDSGLMEKVGLEERRHILSEDSEFSARGVESLLRSLAAQGAYKEASEHERGVMRHTIREAGLRAMSDNRVQSRRLPRRFVEGASDDITRNLYDYNNSSSNFRARLKYNQAIDDGLKAMWAHVKAERYTPDNEARSIAANEVERRMRAPDPNEYSGAYTDWTRRLSTWSYIDRMMRPSHLILHQTHLPMITAPYMSGRHGIMSTYGATMRAWKELTGFYKAGGHDAWATTWGSALQKGADYAELGKKAYADSADGARIGKMLDDLAEIGVIHPQAGIETQKYLPSRQMGGPLGVLDKTLNKFDTVFRHLTNATEAINRIAGATAAYRLEFNKLTRAGKSEAEAHQAAVEYARQTLTDTQGLYSATNAAPIFKNKFLKPFLQFKQFPQMMYHLLGKLAIQSFKGETREAKVQAMASLATILGMHSMMAGALQGLPLEPFKLLAMIGKGIGLTDSDWGDFENAERRSIKAALGNDVGNVVIHGLGSELLGVDVHHRLGLNSFVTFGMPDQMDSKSVSEFMMNSILGAPGSLVTDVLKGTHKMLNGDIEGGAFQAMPLQFFRDVRNAVNPPANKYGFEPTGADRAKSILGFSPAEKVHAAERKEAVYQAVHEYDQQRYQFTQDWVSASGPDRELVWRRINEWNLGRPADQRLTKGDLFKALHRANRPVSYNASIGGVRTNPHNKGIAQATMDLYE